MCDERDALLQQLQAQLAFTQSALQEARTTSALMLATLDAASDGILAIRADGSMFFNTRMAEIWRLPEERISSIDSDNIREFIAGQLKAPDEYWALVERRRMRPDDTCSAATDQMVRVSWLPTMIQSSARAFSLRYTSSGSVGFAFCVMQKRPSPWRAVTAARGAGRVESTSQTRSWVARPRSRAAATRRSKAQA